MNSTPKKRKRILPILLGIFFVALATIAIVNRKDEVLGIGQAIRYDDFAFTVKSYSRVAVAGSDEFAETAEGVFLVVELLVHNRGAAAPFRFKTEFVELESKDGQVFHSSEKGMAAWHHFPEEGRACPDQVLAGSQCLQEVVFDIPEDLQDFALRISLGGAIADILDLIFYGDKSVRLE